MVKITMNGRHEVKALEIDDSLVGDDKDMLEDLIIAAFNDTQRKIEQSVQEKFAGLAGGLNLPPGVKLPF
jgi:DNA-binding YbaB/EbfC family protein